MFDNIPAVLQVVVFVILGASGLVYLVSTIRRDSHRETRELADTRGDRIGDLEQEVIRLGRKVDRLTGTIEAYQRIKAEEIAVEVARLLETRMPRRTDPTPA